MSRRTASEVARYIPAALFTCWCCILSMGLMSRAESPMTYDKRTKAAWNTLPQSAQLFHKVRRFPADSGELFELDNRKQRCSDAEIALVYDICTADRIEELVSSIKSVLLFSDCQNLRIIVFAQTEYLEKTRRQLKILLGAPMFRKFNVKLSVERYRFPEDQIEKDWENVHHLCWLQRLFLPELLQNDDAVAYIDTDTVFIRPVNELWCHFGKMGSNVIMAASREHEHASNSWYLKTGIPFVPPFGINSGVMLMNLTRMRQFGWFEKAKETFVNYKAHMKLVQQDIINIIFSFYPGNLSTLPCIWNFRGSVHCTDVGNLCPSAKSGTIGLFHGSSKSFHGPLGYPDHFYAIYQVFQQFDPYKMDPRQLVYALARALLGRTMSRVCDTPYRNSILQLV